MDPAIDALGPDLVVRNIGALHGASKVPPDKSIAHRSLMLAALAAGSTEISGVPQANDVGRTRACLAALGIRIEERDGRTIVFGAGMSGLAGPPVTLDCGRSGTTIRLLAGLLSGQDRQFRLEADPQLAARPMDRVVHALTALGAVVTCADGRPPIEGFGGSLPGGEVRLHHASAQVGSAALLAGLTARRPVTVHYPAAVRDHTERLLAAMGAPIVRAGLTTTLSAPVAQLRAPGGHLEVPGDFSSAAFIVAAALSVRGSEVTMREVGLNPGRIGFLDAVRSMGAAATVTSQRDTTTGEPVGDLRVAFGRLTAIELPEAVVPSMIDEIPCLAVLASLAHGTTTIRGASELRFKESDRLSAMAVGLNQLGARVEELPDGLRITGPSYLVGTRLDGLGDHRVVMALAVAGLAAEGRTVIRGADAVADSFPEFAASVNELGLAMVA